MHTYQLIQRQENLQTSFVPNKDIQKVHNLLFK